LSPKKKIDHPYIPNSALEVRQEMLEEIGTALRGESVRIRRTHLPSRASVIGTTVRAADKSLFLNGGGNGLIDTTHFDTVRFPPPEWAHSVMAQAAADGSLAYTPYRGHPGVLKDLSQSLSCFLGVTIGPVNLALTPGTQGALFTTLSALIDEGDLVLLPDPEYLFIERMLAFLGAKVERIPVYYEAGIPSLDLDIVQKLMPQKPRLIVFSHPNNPTGAVYGQDMIVRLVALARKHECLVLVDELYSRLVYDGTPFYHLIAQEGMSKHCITLLGPSKTESMSGYRVGVVVGPADVMEGVEQTLAITSLRAPGYAQHLLSKWLVSDSEFLQQRLLDLAALRKTTTNRLREVPGLKVFPQQGTAYLFPDVSALGATDVEVAGRLRREAGVIVSPGYQFGPRGVGHFRVCYARDEVQWDAALGRMVACLTRLADKGGPAA